MYTACRPFKCLQISLQKSPWRYGIHSNCCCIYNRVPWSSWGECAICIFCNKIGSQYKLTTKYISIVWVFSYLAAITITAERAANLDLRLALKAYSSESPFTCHVLRLVALVYAVSSEGPVPMSQGLMILSHGGLNDRKFEFG
jgi:hypothetical protein